MTLKLYAFLSLIGVQNLKKKPKKKNGVFVAILNKNIFALVSMNYENHIK